MIDEVLTKYDSKYNNNSQQGSTARMRRSKLQQRIIGPFRVMNKSQDLFQLIEKMALEKLKVNNETKFLTFLVSGQFFTTSNKSSLQKEGRFAQGHSSD